MGMARIDEMVGFEGGKGDVPSFDRRKFRDDGSAPPYWEIPRWRETALRHAVVYVACNRCCLCANEGDRCSRIERGEDGLVEPGNVVALCRGCSRREWSVAERAGLMRIAESTAPILRRVVIAMIGWSLEEAEQVAGTFSGTAAVHDAGCGCAGMMEGGAGVVGEIRATVQDLVCHVARLERVIAERSGRGATEVVS